MIKRSMKTIFTDLLKLILNLKMQIKKSIDSISSGKLKLSTGIDNLPRISSFHNYKCSRKKSHLNNFKNFTRPKPPDLGAITYSFCSKSNLYNCNYCLKNQID